MNPRALARPAIVVAAALLALAIVTKASLAGVLQGRQPAQAVAWAPLDSESNASLAAQLVAAERVADGRRFAAAALQRSPTSVVALRTLALASESSGDEAGALRLMRLAHLMSRRDRPTELWFLRRSIRVADFDAAVRHFDIAMRTSSRGADQLIPLLVAATEDPRVVPPLNRALDGRPEWKIPFLVALASNGPRPDHIMLLSRGRLDPARPAEQVALRHLLDRMTVARRFDLAWQAYRWLRPDVAGPSPGGLRDGGFEDTRGLAPFDWQLLDEADLAARREAPPGAPNGYALSLIAQNGRTGDVARQVVRLAPGAYDLTLIAGNVPTERSERPQVVINCAQSSAPLLAMVLPQANGPPRRYGARFTVPSGCAWQWIYLRISGSETRLNNPWIDNLAISRSG